MFSESLKNYAQQTYDSRMQWIADRQAAVSKENTAGRPGRWMKQFQEKVRQKLAACTPNQQILMKFLYGTMPLRDLAEYEFEIFSDFVKHGIWLREAVEWCRELPEEIFLNDVLYYRINSENIEKCRPFFYEKLKDKIQGKSLEEAVLEINYWVPGPGLRKEFWRKHWPTVPQKW